MAGEQNAYDARAFDQKMQEVYVTVSFLYFLVEKRETGGCPSFHTCSLHDTVWGCKCMSYVFVFL